MSVEAPVRPIVDLERVKQIAEENGFGSIDDATARGLVGKSEEEIIIALRQITQNAKKQ